MHMLELKCLKKNKTEGATKNPLVGKQRGCVTKEGTKKMKKGDKNNMIQIAESWNKKNK